MKYSYAYKTSDGQRHEDSMEADSREEVFAALRARGIKAIKVVAADGSKANGEVRGVRKRAVAALVALVAVGVGVVAYRGGTRSVAPVAANDGGREATALPSTAPRHQIYGDPAVMAAFEQGDFTGVLDAPGDQLLAWYAQPGKLMCPPNADATVCTAKMASNLLAVARFSVLPKSENSAKHKAQSTFSLIIITENDPREVRELKQILNGMREELRSYLANGNGTVYSYWRRLNERLADEQQIYERTKRELEADPSPALRDERNTALRNLGLRTIPAPRRSAGLPPKASQTTAP